MMKLFVTKFKDTSLILKSRLPLSQKNNKKDLFHKGLNTDSSVLEVLQTKYTGLSAKNCRTIRSDSMYFVDKET